jgi:hypothetical protein
MAEIGLSRSTCPNWTDAVVRGVMSALGEFGGNVADHQGNFSLFSMDG